ncbi:MAG: alkaline phosphatase family protein [Acidimicrobiales bacterium]|nr:alkaline phosphatase family protein [Acidimicrobiales bacterium]
MQGTGIQQGEQPDVEFVDRADEAHAPRLLLGPLLRYVDDTSATVWVETSQPCRVEILGSATTTFQVRSRHYALVVIEGLEPGSATEYVVTLDDARVWPEFDSSFPPSLIRTSAPGSDVSVLFGSCRAAAPHEPPYTLELTLDDEGRGVDSLWAHAMRMTSEPPERWPHLLLLVGDQIYADDSSPRAKDRIESIRGADSDLPSEIVASFEEYCWLYHEAWSAPHERWLLSTVPSAMIFDDHDMIDDWNISEAWVTDIRSQPWWQRHAIDGLMSYWIYQHLGNLSPAEIRKEGLLEQLLAEQDGTAVLEKWAGTSEEFTPIPGGYRFSYTRRVGDVTVVVIDCRNARVLNAGARQMVGDEEWNWIRSEALAADGDLILATSVPVFIADGLHDLQLWNERVCDGAWGRTAARWGEKLRRALDLEDWSAFSDSYQKFVALVDDLRSKDDPLRSIVVASGDIHFSYAAQLPRQDRNDSRVWQVVSSPIRNALIPPERGVMRSTLTPLGARIGDLLRRSVRARRTRPGIDMTAGPFFANNMCELHFRGNEVELVIEQAAPNDNDEPELHQVANVLLSGGTTS